MLRALCEMKSRSDLKQRKISCIYLCPVLHVQRYARVSFLTTAAGSDAATLLGSHNCAVLQEFGRSSS